MIEENKLLITVAVCLFAMILILIIILYYFSLGQKNMLTIKLQERRLEINFQKNLLLTTIRTQEKERNHIAQELNENINSKLLITKQNLVELKSHLVPSHDTDLLCEKIEYSLMSSIDRTKSLAHELNPDINDDFKIQDIITNLANEVSSTRILTIHLGHLELIKLSEKLNKIHLYRIIQELINNTLKYANAQNISIDFQKTKKEEIKMIYTDDGIGFNMEQVKNGLGIGNIKTRCELLSGKLEINSATGNGVKVAVIFPNK